MTSQNPSGASGFAVEIKTAVSTHAAIECAGTLKGWLGRPGEGALFDGKVGQPQNDLIHSMQWEGGAST